MSSPDTDTTTFLLVHGAWGGSYGFRLLRPHLQAAGHEVHTPSLTGIGERSHLVGPHVDLSLHIEDVRNAIFCEDLDNIALLGFSYGGMVVTGLLDQIGDRVRHLIYLDAVVPRAGQTAIDTLGPMATTLADMAVNGVVPPLPRDLGSPEANAWSNARRVGQPIGTLTEPVSLSKPVEEWPFTRTFIKATEDPNESAESGFWAAAHHARESPAWNYSEVATNHMVPLTKPAELAAILLDIVNASGAP